MRPSSTISSSVDGMNRVAAKIAEEVGVLLQHHDMNAGARQQKSEHHPAGPPPAMQHCVEIVELAMFACSAGLAYSPCSRS